MVRVYYHSGFPMIKWIDHSAWHLDTRQACSIYIYIYLFLYRSGIFLSSFGVTVTLVLCLWTNQAGIRSQTSPKPLNLELEQTASPKKIKVGLLSMGELLYTAPLRGECWNYGASMHERISVTPLKSRVHPSHFKFGDVFLSMIQDRDHIPESDIVEVVQFLWGEFMYVLWVPGKC